MPVTTGRVDKQVRSDAGGAAVAQSAHGDAGRSAAAGAMGAAMRERANYDRAFGACMDGRGYTVK